MFTVLIEGFREIRVQLTTGYLTLFFAWLVWSPIGAAASLGQFGQELGSLADYLGPGVVVGLLTFSATLAGGFVDRIATGRIRDWIDSRDDRADWHRLLDWAGDSEWLDSMDKHRIESTYRLNLAVILIPVSIAFVWRSGSWWWLVLLSLPPLFWIDWVSSQNHAIQGLAARLRRHSSELESELRSIDFEGKEAKIREQAAGGRVSAVTQDVPRISAAVHASKPPNQEAKASATMTAHLESLAQLEAAQGQYRKCKDQLRILREREQNLRGLRIDYILKSFTAHGHPDQ